MDLSEYRKLGESDFNEALEKIKSVFSLFLPNGITYKRVIAFAYALLKKDSEWVDRSSFDGFIASACPTEEIKRFLTEQLTFPFEIVRSFDACEEKQLKSLILFFMGEEGRRRAIGVPLGFDEFTPGYVSEFADGLLNIKAGEKVADFCSGGGSFLRESMLRHSDAEYYGIEKDPDFAAISQIRFEIIGKRAKITIDDVLNAKESETTYDKIFSDIPVLFVGSDEYASAKRSEAAKELNDLNGSITSTVGKVDWAFVLEAMKKLNGGGTAVFFADDSILSERYRGVRMNLVDSGKIKAVISVFNMAYRNDTIFVMNNGDDKNDKIKFIDATDVFDPSKTRFNMKKMEEDIKELLRLYFSDEENDNVVVLKKSDVALNNYSLIPKLYLGMKKDMSLLRFDDSIALGEAARRITRGWMTTALTLSLYNNSDGSERQMTGKFKILKLADVQNGMIDYDSLESLVDDQIPEKYAKYCANNNSLIIGKNDPTKMTVATVSDDTVIIPTANFFVIDFDENILDPWYVLAYFKSNPDALGSKTSSGSLPSLSSAGIESVCIPKLDIEKQRRIGEVYKQKLEELAAMKRKFDKKIKDLKTVFTEQINK